VVLAVEWYSIVGLIFTFGGLVLAVIGIPRLIGGVRRQQLASAVESASQTIDLLETTNRIRGEAGVDAHLDALRADFDRLEDAAAHERTSILRGLLVGVTVLALLGSGVALILFAQNNRIGDTQSLGRASEARIECRQQVIAAYDVALGNLHMAELTGNAASINESSTRLATAEAPLVDLDKECGAPG
jgi:hypothetical protein